MKKSTYSPNRKARRVVRHMKNLIVDALLILSLSAAMYGGFVIVTVKDTVEAQNAAPSPTGEANSPIVAPDPCTLSVIRCFPDDESELADTMLAGTPMQGLGSLIVTTAAEYDINWRLVIGIAEAESSRGKHYFLAYDKNCFNAWGIKPPKGMRSDGSYLQCYDNWKSGIRTFSAMVSRKYNNKSPEQMVYQYVGWYNPNWITNVKKFY